MQVGETYARPLLGSRVLDAQWNDDLAGIAGKPHLTPDVFGVIATIRQDQEHRPAVFDRLGDLTFPRPARIYIPQRPTGYATSLKLPDYLDGGRAIFAAMAYEQEQVDSSYATAPSMPKG